MPQAPCVKYLVKPGHLGTLVDWIARLDSRSVELVEALAEAGFIAEAVFLEESDSGDHLVIYSSARDLQAGIEILSHSKRSLIQEFNQLLAKNVDIENAAFLELIYHTP